MFVFFFLILVHLYVLDFSVTSFSLNYYNFCLWPSWNTPPGAGFSRCVENQLVAFAFFLRFGLSVVSLTHSHFQFFSILPWRTNRQMNRRTTWFYFTFKTYSQSMFKCSIRTVFETITVTDIKGKITKIPSSKENSNRKLLHQIAKPKAQTHQTHGKQLSYSWLATGIFLCRKWWIKPDFIAI